MDGWNEQLRRANELLENDRPREAARVIEEAAAVGTPEAIETLGWVYLEGIGVPKNENKAVEQFRKASDLGLTTAMVQLGAMYGQGVGVSRDIGVANKLFMDAARLGSDDAHLRLGFMYKNGAGTSKDLHQSLFHYNEAVRLQNPEAMFQFGSMYLEGDGVTKDISRGIDLLKLAGERGHDRALGYLGFIYGTGQDVDLDRDKAREYLHRSARLGNVTSMRIIMLNYPPVLSLGTIVMSSGLAQVTDEETRKYIIRMHAAGMWGDVPPATWDKNDHALKVGQWVQSVYDTDGPPVVAQTTPDRKSTWIGFLDKSFDAPQIDLLESAKRAYRYYKFLRTAGGFLRKMLE